MGFEIDFGIWGGIFAVPDSLADKYLKLCSESQLKVLLLALRDAPDRVDERYIAKRLGMAPDQVCDCLEYWEKQGIFRQSAAPAPADSAPVQRPEASSPAPGGRLGTPPADTVVENGVGSQKITTVRSRGHLTPGQINEMSRTDKNIPLLLQEFQQRLGKPLSPTQTEALIYTYSYLSLTPDYLLMVAEYCKSIGKGSVAYIVQTAADWVQKGVDTHERAEAHILELTRKNDSYRRIQSMFGIGGRSLTPKETGYIDSWLGAMGFDFDMIKLAYDRTVDNTGKLAFGYMNTILQRWHTKGISTVSDAEREMEAGRPQKSAARGAKSSAAGESSYDMDEISRLMDEGK